MIVFYAWENKMIKHKYTMCQKQEEPSFINKKQKSTDFMTE